MSHYVRIYYEPYDNFFDCSHKPQKLRGLREHLLHEGFRVELVPVQSRDYCVVEMQRREIFRCNIRNLKFNTPSSRDPVCRRAVDAVLDASRRFQLADDYFWIQSFLTETALAAAETRSLGPKNYFIREDKSLCLCALESMSEAFE